MSSIRSSFGSSSEQSSTNISGYFPEQVNTLDIHKHDDKVYYLCPKKSDPKHSIFVHFYTSKRWKNPRRPVDDITPNINWGTASRKDTTWEHFAEGCCSTTGRPVAICLVCNHVLAHGTINGTSNLTKHKRTNREHLNVLALNSSSIIGSRNLHEGSILPWLEKLKFHSVNTKNRGSATSFDLSVPTGWNEKTANTFVLEFLVSACVPMNVVGNPHFRRLLRYISGNRSYIAPSRPKVSRDLRQSARIRQTEIRDNVLPEDIKISLAIDSWTSPNRMSYLSILAYFIDTDWRLQEVLIGFEHISGAHNGPTMAKHLMGTVEAYDLQHQLLGITTDNASNNTTMTTALKECLQEVGTKWDAANNHIPCMAHIIQLVTGAFLKQLGVIGQQKYYGERERDMAATENELGLRMARFASQPAGYGKMIEKIRRFAVAVNSSPQRRASYIDLQRGREKIAILPILDVKTRWNSTVNMIHRAYRLRYYSREWLQHYQQYKVLWTTDQEWHALEYILSALEPFNYWTLVMSKRHEVTLHHTVQLYDDIYGLFDKLVVTLRNKKQQWKVDIRSAVAAAQEKLAKYYQNVTPETGMLLLLGTMLDPYVKTSRFRRWDKRDGTNYARQYSDKFLEYFQAKYLPSLDDEATTTTSSQSSPSLPRGYDSDLSDDEDLLSTTRDSAARTSSAEFRGTNILKLAKDYIRSPTVPFPSATQSQLPTDEDISDPARPTASFFRPCPLSYWQNLSQSGNEDIQPLVAMARDVFSVMPHGVGVESSFSIGRKAVSWQQAAISSAHLQSYMLLRHKLKNDVLRMDTARTTRQRLEAVSAVSDYSYFKAEVTKATELRRSRRARRGHVHIARRDVELISDSEDERGLFWDDFDDDGCKAMASYNNRLPEVNSTRETITSQSYFEGINIRPTNRAMGDSDASEDSSMDGEDDSSIDSCSDDDTEEDKDDTLATDDLEVPTERINEILAGISPSCGLPIPSRIDPQPIEQIVGAFTRARTRRLNANRLAIPAITEETSRPAPASYVSRCSRIPSRESSFKSTHSYEPTLMRRRSGLSNVSNAENDSEHTTNVECDTEEEYYDMEEDHDNGNGKQGEREEECFVSTRSRKRGRSGMSRPYNTRIRTRR